MEILLILLIPGLLSIFWIWMFIDCLMSPIPQGEKIIWLLVIFFSHIIGALLYWFMARGRGNIVI